MTSATEHFYKSGRKQEKRPTLKENWRDPVYRKKHSEGVKRSWNKRRGVLLLTEIPKGSTVLAEINFEEAWQRDLKIVGVKRKSLKPIAGETEGRWFFRARYIEVL